MRGRGRLAHGVAHPPRVSVSPADGHFDGPEANLPTAVRDSATTLLTATRTSGGSSDAMSMTAFSARTSIAPARRATTECPAYSLTAASKVRRRRGSPPPARDCERRGCRAGRLATEEVAAIARIEQTAETPGVATSDQIRLDSRGEGVACSSRRRSCDEEPDGFVVEFANGGKAPEPRRHADDYVLQRSSGRMSRAEHRISTRDEIGPFRSSLSVLQGVC